MKVLQSPVEQLLLAGMEPREFVSEIVSYSQRFSEKALLELAFEQMNVNDSLDRRVTDMVQGG